MVAGIQYLMDDKGKRVAVQIDLKKYGNVWEDFWDGMVSESRKTEKSISYSQYRATRKSRGRRD